MPITDSTRINFGDVYIHQSIGELIGLLEKEDHRASTWFQFVKRSHKRWRSSHQAHQLVPYVSRALEDRSKSLDISHQQVVRQDSNSSEPLEPTEGPPPTTTSSAPKDSDDDLQVEDVIQAFRYLRIRRRTTQQNTS